ncbi:GtrA family protein [Patescibacteria group bacterium]|nr:GtrA family protein [Patescibacteria group bacterium]
MRLFSATREEWARRARFFVIAFAAYALYLLVFRVLRTTTSEFSPTIILALATISGDLLNYIGNRYWVFRARDQKIWRQGGKFLLVMGMTFVSQLLFFWVGRHLLHIPELPLLFLLPLIRMIANYLLHAGFTFASRIRS